MTIRIGVLYPDGSISVMRDGLDDDRTIADATKERDHWNMGNQGIAAKVVSIQLDESDMVELKREDLP